MRTQSAVVSALFAVVALLNWSDSGAETPWEKFVNAPGQAWLTNGACPYEHTGKKHIVDAEWKGGWIRIEKVPDSPDENPQFTVEVSPNISDYANWNAMTLSYDEGDDSSNVDFPLASCDASTSSRPERSAPEEPDRLVGTVTLIHTDETGVRNCGEHEIEIYLWQDVTSSGEEAKKYGPLEIVLFHEAGGGSHNGIVH